MFDPLTGLYSMVYNGENGFPNVNSFIIRNNLTTGLPYRFKVRASY